MLGGIEEAKWAKNDIYCLFGLSSWYEITMKTCHVESPRIKASENGNFCYQNIKGTLSTLTKWRKIRVESVRSTGLLRKF